MANNCRQICERSKYDIRVFCLNSSFEAEGLLKNDPIDIKADILVTTVFCYESIINQMSQSFRPHSLQYVWFHQFDVMCHINEMRTMDAVDKLLSQGLDIQVNIKFTPIDLCVCQLEFIFILFIRLHLDFHSDCNHF